MTTVTVPVPAAFDVPQLRKELEAAGYTPTGGTRQGDQLTITFDADVDGVDVARIVAEHTPADFDQFAQIEAKCERVASGEDSFTNQQAQRLLARLALFVLRRLQ